jgi:hypothetical protein
MFRKADTARTTDLNFSSAWLSGSPKSESRSGLHPAARDSWQQARSELESLLQKEPVALK